MQQITRSRRSGFMSNLIKQRVKQLRRGVQYEKSRSWRRGGSQQVLCKSISFSHDCVNLLLHFYKRTFNPQKLFLSVTHPKHFKSPTNQTSQNHRKLPKTMETAKPKYKENCSLRSNKSKPAHFQTPPKNTKKQIKDSSQKEKGVMKTKEVKGESLRKRKSKPKVYIFSREHLINNKKEVTEVCDLGTGKSTYSPKTSAKQKCTYIMDDFNEIEAIGPKLVNVSPFATTTHYMKTEWKEVKPRKCSCSKKSTSKSKNCCCHEQDSEAKSGLLSKTEELKIRYDDFSVFSKKEYRNVIFFTGEKEEETTADPFKCPHNLCSEGNCLSSKDSSVN